MIAASKLQHLLAWQSHSYDCLPLPAGSTHETVDHLSRQPTEGAKRDGDF